ncbi:hypothetical protein AMIS_29430 [Actinoplanes missouriensis 431]|uniref:Uncharacterized protein n=1 Tax=Actinoplanes missouriensis (strain ATCC 14538 / DSM 43046 / CBS 188.64 / JCM 3121 / NBRC 102363 / NCIMB 12654 / NRRL B-3342 / UNCC 431) TaxID=512565 RepID=I0H576_ACTM4|nr:hypothetical protein [Actinoplanes missouriensis]BAL88163.1 hypothetical protein AMIS_29430 [Actinoplanes missouriensis 431]
MTRTLTTAATVSYLCNAAFGAAVAVGAVDNRRLRWVHHALYVVTSSLTTAALVASAAERRPACLALLPVTVPLAALPYAGGRIRRHASVAGSAAPAYAIALVLAWRNR